MNNSIKDKNYNFREIEKKWQREWERKRVFEVKENIKNKKGKYYVLEMFPYPSGSGLHMGHAFNYTIGDIYARFMRMQGWNVLYPMGYDSFGLPAENAAIKAKSHPKKFTEQAIRNFISQQKSLGLSYDWSKTLKTSDPEYYKWNQYFFLKFFENGLVYRKKAGVNFCSKCNTVLANEQVHNGCCWRHTDTEVEIRQLEQWFIKTRKYADELLQDLNKLQWPDRIKIMQDNWIGKSHGTEILFEIENPDKINKKNSNCIIVHGCPSNTEKAMNPETRTYDKHWIPWLKTNLEKNGVETQTPLMPTPWKPDYHLWKKEFEKLKVNENTILIGHSCGGAFLVRWIHETKTKIKKLILVSPGKAGKARDEFKSNLYGNKVMKSLDKYIKEKIIIFTSNNDIPGHIEGAYEYEKELPAQIIFLKDHGHFCEKDMGTNEFPELLNEVISNRKKWPIFTTRPDTLFGVTFMVISAQHSRLMELVTEKQRKEVENFIKKIKSTKQEDMDKLDKEGVFTGSYAANPLTNEKVPVYAGNFVVADYGSGMVMAVPAHDQRDFEFAKKYKIPVKLAIQTKEKNNILDEKNLREAYTGNGVLVNSKEFNDLDSDEAKEHITKVLEFKKLGNRKIQYKLRDWLISRQRYWGTPIPVIYCQKCGIVPVNEKDLPVKLPQKVKFGIGNPLETNKKFVNVKCPECKGKARRETDTMDTFFDSSWYFLRYEDNKNSKMPFDKKKVDYWMPVDQYIGGAEHAVMHLIYARFFTKALRDLGFFNKKIDEPFIRLFNQGMLHGDDGMVMSKSRGNVVLPEEVSKKYGIDTARIFLMSIASPDKDTQWSDNGVKGSLRFVKKVTDFFDNLNTKRESSLKLQSRANKTIKEITEEIKDFRYNIAIIKLRGLFELIEQENEVSKEDLETFLKMLSIFAPHIAEELWHKMGNKSFISLAEWPKADEKKINLKLEQQVENFEKTVSDIVNILKIIKEKQGKEAEKIYLYVIPNEKENYHEAILSKKFGKEVKVYAVNDKNKYDPENKSGKAKPGRPAIYIF